MSETVRVTREQFVEAIRELGERGTVADVAEIYYEAVPSLRTVIEPALIAALGRCTEKLDDRQEFESIIGMQGNGVQEKVARVLSIEHLPNTVFIEAAIVSAVETVVHALPYLERGDIPKTDRHRIAQACMIGMWEDAKLGAGNRIAKMLNEPLLTGEQRTVINRAISEALSRA
jgi:hypothetical protein